MNTIVITSQNIGCHGWLYHEHLRQRKTRFVDDLAWDIPHDEYIERDQYDRAETHYVLIEEAGRLTGYARLLPTSASANFGNCRFTYMVKDAVDGKLPGIPASILFDGQPPSSSDVWEMTRFGAVNRKSMSAVFKAAANHLAALGVKRTVSFTRAAYGPILSAIDLPTRPLGPIVSYDEGDGKTYCVLETSLVRWSCGESKTPVRDVRTDPVEDVA